MDTRFSKVGGKAGFEGLWVGNRGSRSGASAAAASPLLPSPQVRTHPGFPELAPGQTTELPAPAWRHQRAGMCEQGMSPAAHPSLFTLLRAGAKAAVEGREAT